MQRSIGIVWVGSDLRLPSPAKKKDRWTGRTLTSDLQADLGDTMTTKGPMRERALELEMGLEKRLAQNFAGLRVSARSLYERNPPCGGPKIKLYLEILKLK
jgi:hypothetical protein